MLEMMQPENPDQQHLKQAAASVSLTFDINTSLQLTRDKGNLPVNAFRSRVKTQTRTNR